MNIVFFGTSSFSVTILQHLINTYSVIAIVTKPDKPQGRSLQLRPPPVKEWAQTHMPQTPLYQPPIASADSFVDFMQTLSPDLFVVASYGEIMKTSLLNVPRLGAINVHASLLPRWRGAAPIQRALLAGDQKTGITIMKMVLRLDAGDILAQQPVPISPEMTHGELEHLLAVAAKTPLLNVIHQIEQGGTTPTPQDESLVTFAPKFLPEETEIQWKKTAQEIHRLIRALSPSPGAWTRLKNGKKLKIKRSQVVSYSTPKKNEWIIPCGAGYLNILEVQLEGKKSMPIADFLRGYSSWITSQQPNML